MKKQHEAFINAYVNDIKRNQTAAAIKAGYSERTARQQASRLMSNPEIAAAIEERLEEIRRQNTAETNEILMFCTRVMRGEEKLDNIPLLAGDGVQEMQETKPGAKDRLKAAEMLGRYYGIFEKRPLGEDDAGGIVILPEIEAETEGI